MGSFRCTEEAEGPKAELPSPRIPTWAVESVALTVPLRRRVANRRGPSTWLYS